MQTMSFQKEKTCRELFNQFKDRYTIAEIDSHPQIQKLYTYLQHRCSMSSGNYYHEPSQEIRELLGKFLNYHPEKKPAGQMPDELNIQIMPDKDSVIGHKLSITNY